eukprot:2070340-Rhodomonas_salina.1
MWSDVLTGTVMFPNKLPPSVGSVLYNTGGGAYFGTSRYGPSIVQGMCCASWVLDLDYGRAGLAGMKNAFRRGKKDKSCLLYTSPSPRDRG